MDEKSNKKENLEIEIRKIEEDFLNVIGEITDVANIRQFTDIYRQLHSLLMDSHNKNKQLTNIVQILNNQILSNATKVSSLLKMSEDDHKCIEKYREEFDRAWKLVSTTQEKEMKAKDIVESLKGQVNNLSNHVMEQNTEEENFEVLKQNIAGFLEEMDLNAKELIVIEDELLKNKDTMSQRENHKKQIEKEIETINEAIDHESMLLVKLSESKQNLSTETERSKNFEEKLVSDQETNINDIKHKKNCIDDMHKEFQVQKNILLEYEKELGTSLNSKKLRQQQLDREMEATSRTETRKQSLIHEINEADNQIKVQTSKSKSLDASNEQYRIELDLCKSEHVKVKDDISQTIKHRREMNKELVKKKLESNTLSLNIHQMNRDISSKIGAIKVAEKKIDNEVAAGKEVRNQSRFASICTSNTKTEIDSLNSAALSLEVESKSYTKQASDFKSRTSRYIDSVSVINKENQELKKTLKSIVDQTKNHDEIVKKMRKERDSISNKISGVETDNDSVRKEINIIKEEISAHKALAHSLTKDCIVVHFKSRGVEKEIDALKEVVKITQNMITEAKSTIISYKAEQTKLRLILDEAARDINIAKIEHKSIVEVSRLLKSQVTKRELDIKKELNNIKNLEYDLHNRGYQYEQQSEHIKELEKEIGEVMIINSRLRNRTCTAAALTIEKISLESAILHQQSLRNKLENELLRPMNVHRWTILAHMQPDVYKQIQMIMYLKERLEDIKRKKLRVEEVKDNIIREINTAHNRMKNIHYSDGQEALDAMNNSLKNKELEISKMEKESDDIKLHCEQLKELISQLRCRLNDTKSTTLNLRQKNTDITKPSIPMIPLMDKPIETTRLGGGFSLVSPRPETARVNSKQVDVDVCEHPQSARTCVSYKNETDKGYGQPLSSRREKKTSNTKAKKPKAGVYIAPLNLENVKFNDDIENNQSNVNWSAKRSGSSIRRAQNSSRVALESSRRKSDSSKSGGSSSAKSSSKSKTDNIEPRMTRAQTARAELIQMKKQFERPAPLTSRREHQSIPSHIISARVNDGNFSSRPQTARVTSERSKKRKFHEIDDYVVRPISKSKQESIVPELCVTGTRQIQLMSDSTTFFTGSVVRVDINTSSRDSDEKEDDF